MKLMNVVRLLVLGGLVLCGTSCATRGNNFSSNVNWIKANETAKDNVQKVLGNPFQTGYSSGSSTWTYGFYQYALFGTSHTKELKIYWNRNGTVKNYSFSSSFPEDIRSNMAQQAQQQNSAGSDVVD